MVDDNESSGAGSKKVRRMLHVIKDKDNCWNELVINFIKREVIKNIYFIIIFLNNVSIQIFLPVSIMAFHNYGKFELKK